MLARSAAQSLARRAPVARAALASTATSSSSSSCNFSSTTAARTSTNTNANALDYGVISKEDFGTFKEYSVIHTDRSLNLMSDPFQRVMRDLNQLLKVTYRADKVVIIPGYVTCCIVTLRGCIVLYLFRFSTHFTQITHSYYYIYYVLLA